MINSTGNRILMLLENNPYPQDVRVRKEAMSLVDAGYRVTVISPKKPDQSWFEVVNQVHAYRYPAPPDADSLLGYLWEYGYSLVATFLISLVVFFRQGFDVIHAHNPPDLFVIIAAFYKLFGKRFVFDHHDLSPELYFYGRFGNKNPVVYNLLIMFEKLTCRLADMVIATNESYRAIEMERGKVPADRIVIVRNGPDLNKVRPVEPDHDLRQKAGTIIGYVGVLGFQDGLDYLLRALHHLAFDLKRRDFYCVIIGDGAALTSLKTLAAELNIEEYIWFTGLMPIDKVVKYLSSVDICVDPDPSSPYNDRCTMVKMTEYMALGKPIVAFDLPEHRFSAQDSALYVRPNQELEFAQAIAQLMDNPKRQQTMGAYGRKRVEAGLAWSHSEKQLLKAYQKLYPEPLKKVNIYPE